MKIHYLLGFFSVVLLVLPFFSVSSQSFPQGVYTRFTPEFIMQEVQPSNESFDYFVVIFEFAIEIWNNQPLNLETVDCNELNVDVSVAPSNSNFSVNKEYAKWAGFCASDNQTPRLIEPNGVDTLYSLTAIIFHNQSINSIPTGNYYFSPPTLMDSTQFDSTSVLKVEDTGIFHTLSLTVDNLDWQVTDHTSTTSSTVNYPQIFLFLVLLTVVMKLKINQANNYKMS